MARLWIRIALLICLAAIPLSPSPAGADAPAAPAPVAMQEMVFGNGTPGPFRLSWTAVRIGSERLSVNGTSLYLGLDYLLDFESGALTFSQPLRLDQIAQVEYVYDSARAKPNHTPAQVPLSLRVWGGDSGSLQMIGAMRPATTVGGPGSASMLGFRGETALGGAKVSSLFLMAPGPAASAGAGGSGAARGSAWQTAALQFGASKTQGPFRFSGSVAQAGTGFTQAKDYQLQQGLRVMDLSAAFDPSRRVSFSSQVKRQDALDPSTKAQEQQSLTNRLTLAPSDATKLTFSQESTSKARPKGKAETIDTLRAQIEQKLGGSVTATALTEQRRTDSAGTTTTTGVNLAASPSRRAQIAAGFVRSDNSRQGTDTTSNVQLAVRPAEQLGFRIGFNQHLSSRQGSQTGTDWGVTAGRNGLLKVEGKTTEKVAASGPGQQDEQLRVEATPLRGVKLGTLMATTQVGQEEARDTRETSLELSPLKQLRVAGTLREQEVSDGVARVRGVSGSVKPGSFLDLSGTYKLHEAPAGDAVITRKVQLALMPIRGLKLQGAYLENPEDSAGQVQDTTNTSLGLESTVGSLVLGGSYTTGQGVAAQREIEQAEFRLALNLWGNSKFYSAYKTSDERAIGRTQGRTLSLGFTRSITGNFYLLLEGELSQVRVDGIANPGMSDQRAQARLGLRF